MDESPSGTGSARSQVGDAAGQVQEKARETAVEAKARAGDQLRQQVDERSTQVGEQTRSVADAMRRTGEHLRSEQKETPAKLVDGTAERAERLGSYLERSSADDILGDVEDFARRQPLAIAAGAFALGLLASRFLKASSSRRFQQHDGARFTRRYAEREYVPPAPDYIPPATTAVPSSAVGEPPLVRPREGSWESA